VELPPLTALRRLALLAAALFALALPSTALAGNENWVEPPDLAKAPKGETLTPNRALEIAARTSAVQKVRREDPAAKPRVFYDKVTHDWIIRYVDGKKELAEVNVDDPSGNVTSVWTGPQVLWGMARGLPGAFGRKINAPYVWLPLCLLFLAPFIDFRRPFRLLHLDLLVMLGFGISHIYFNRADISTSTPLVYPVLLYLLGRALMIGFGPRRREGPLIPHASLRWLAAGLVFLIGFRIGLNVFDSNVIDVGWAGLWGADRLQRGLSLYAPLQDTHLNTYGPVTYLLYYPFEQIWPTHGWDDLPGAHAAAITFDLVTIAGMYVLGRRLRPGAAGKALGLALAYAWTAYPYSAFVLESNSNDTIVAMFVVWALVFMRSVPGRALLLALGGAAKFVPWALAPLMASPFRTRGDRSVLAFWPIFALVATVAVLPFLDGASLRDFADKTILYQAGRDSPFSIWGLHPSLHPLQVVVEALALAFAIALAAVPRERNAVQVAALAAAVLIAVQIAASHWFYLYVVWFTPPLLAALFSEYGISNWRMPVARPASSESTSTAFSHGSSSDGSNRVGTWVRNLSSASSRRTPITPPRAPVIPTSVT
jgi:hypothetical protein